MEGLKNLWAFGQNSSRNLCHTTIEVTYYLCASITATFVGLCWWTSAKGLAKSSLDPFQKLCSQECLLNVFEFRSKDDWPLLASPLASAALVLFRSCMWTNLEIVFQETTLWRLTVTGLAATLAWLCWRQTATWSYFRHSKVDFLRAFKISKFHMPRFLSGSHDKRILVVAV